jgi:hypothetical protein
MKAMLTAVLVAGLSMSVVAQAGPPPVRQQGRQAGRQNQPNPDLGNQGNKPPLNGDAISPAYIQQMFDAMAIVEAERVLPLSAEQYPVFVQKLKRLQEARQQSNRRRMKTMNELRGLVGPQAPPDISDAAIDAKFKELVAAEQQGFAAIHQAQDDLEAGLSVRQRARFRMLEENVERRKVDFLTRVRQGGGPGFEGIPQ